MEFNSIEEIKEYFGIETNDTKELKKEIKKLLQESHSDQTGGSYQSGRQKREHEELTSALNFINNSSTEISITNKEWTSLQKQINELRKYKDEGELIKLQEISRQLSKSIENSGIKFQKKHYSIKISSIVLTSIISALWIFPSIAEKHPIVNEIVNSNRLVYTIIWLISIVITALLWINTKRIEKADSIIKQKYNLDSEQNHIFKLFLVWLRIAFHELVDYDADNHKHIYHFTRDDLFNFILNYYSKLREEFSEIINYKTFELYMSISEVYKSSKDILRIENEKKSWYKRFYHSFFKTPGEIDSDLAQSLTDTIMKKLIERNLIEKIEKKTFNDSYKYSEE